MSFLFLELQDPSFTEILEKLKERARELFKNSSLPDLKIVHNAFKSPFDAFEIGFGNDFVTLFGTTKLSVLYALSKLISEKKSAGWTRLIGRHVPKIGFRCLWFEGEADLLKVIECGCNKVIASSIKQDLMALGIDSYREYIADKALQERLERRLYVFDLEEKKQVIELLKANFQASKSSYFVKGSALSRHVFYSPRFRGYSMEELCLKEVELFEEALEGKGLLYLVPKDDMKIDGILYQKIKTSTRLLLEEKSSFFDSFALFDPEAFNPFTCLAESSIAESASGAVIKASLLDSPLEKLMWQKQPLM